MEYIVDFNRNPQQQRLIQAMRYIRNLIRMEWKVLKFSSASHSVTYFRKAPGRTQFSDQKPIWRNLLNTSLQYGRNELQQSRNGQ